MFIRQHCEKGLSRSMTLTSTYNIKQAAQKCVLKT